MTFPRLTVLRFASKHWDVSAGETVASVDCLKERLRHGAWQQFLAYGEARVLTPRVESVGRPLKLALMLRLLSRGPCYIEDEIGRRRPITARLLARWVAHAVSEPFWKGRFLDQIATDLQDTLARHRRRRPVAVDLSKPPAYLRTDMAVGLRAGGSVGHIAGVVNHLGDFTAPPILLSTDVIPTVGPEVEMHLVPPLEHFWEYPELPSLVMNRAFEIATETHLASRFVSFAYQRYSVNNFSGARLATDRGIPFVLEYNGSEIWMSRHWGTPREHEALSARIEMANLDIADLVVVVSQPMADELIARGVPAAKILVNPNGVEPDRYSPEVDGAAIRARYKLAGKTVIGFIGTFGPWHGAEVLAEAFGRLLAAHPGYRESLRLLMIGDGVKMGEVKSVLDASGVRDLATLTGIVPQAEGPAHLAACDILASPHVPNADGTPFFGSPTKLFEYMAMGKAIVASDLDQVGEILEHGRAAQMAVPGDVESLVQALRILLDDPAKRERLGAEARRLAVMRHSWHHHTSRIIEALKQRVPETEGGHHG